MPYSKIRVSVLYLLIFRVIYATKDSDFLQNSSSFHLVHLTFFRQNLGWKTIETNIVLLQ